MLGLVHLFNNIKLATSLGLEYKIGEVEIDNRTDSVQTLSKC